MAYNCPLVASCDHQQSTHARSSRQADVLVVCCQSDTLEYFASTSTTARYKSCTILTDT